MYHPSRGGVRGGQDQFKWDDVKVDKHRENYIGHSLKAPVGRWQKGKDLFWYTRDKKSEGSNSDALKEEVRRIKEEEEQAMREALGLAPKRAIRPQGNRLDKHEYSELIKRGSTAEDLGGGHAEAAAVQGLGLYKAPCNQGEASSLSDRSNGVGPGKDDEPPLAASDEEDLEHEESRKKRRQEERNEDKRHEDRREEKGRGEDRREEMRRREGRREEKRRGEDKGEEKRRDKREKKHPRDSDDKRHRQHRDKGKRRHDSD